MHRAPPEHANAAPSGSRGGVAETTNFRKAQRPSYKPQPRHPQADINVAVIEKTANSQVRVTLSEWRGATKVHVREFMPGAPAGTWWPSGKKGATLDVERLPELVKALKDPEAEARRLGLLSGLT